MNKKQSWTLILTCLMSVLNTIMQFLGQEFKMARHKMTNRRKDKQTFAHTAGATQSLNLRAKPQRGGFRI